jgi:hypothetical protein
LTSCQLLQQRSEKSTNQSIVVVEDDLFALKRQNSGLFLLLFGHPGGMKRLGRSRRIRRLRLLTGLKTWPLLFFPSSSSDVIAETFPVFAASTSVTSATFSQGWKKSGFFYKTQPSGFFRFFLYICPEERVFRVFSVSRILFGASRL